MEDIILKRKETVETYYIPKESGILSELLKDGYVINWGKGYSAIKIDTYHKELTIDKVIRDLCRKNKWWLRDYTYDFNYETIDEGSYDESTMAIFKGITLEISIDIQFFNLKIDGVIL